MFFYSFNIAFSVNVLLIRVLTTDAVQCKICAKNNIMGFTLFDLYSDEMTSFRPITERHSLEKYLMIYTEERIDLCVKRGQ